MELADTTVWAVSRRKDQAALGAWFAEVLLRGEIAVCDMVRLELLYTARVAHDFRAMCQELDAVPDCPIGKPEWRRALWVYEQLSAGGGAHQRSVQHADLLIAAAAEAAGVPIVHYDEDFERIGAITGQKTRWAAPRGSI